MPNPKLLEYFLVLYRHRSVTKASEELFMTRQTLSGNIRALESELDTTLFLRSNKGLVPTESAEILFRYCEKLEALRRELLEELRQAGGGQPLRIGLHLMYYTGESLRWMKDLVRRLTGRAPVLVNMLNSRESRALLESRRADLVITHQPPEGSALRWEKLLDDDAYAIMRADDPLAARECLDFTADFRGRSLIFPSEETMREVRGILADQDADFHVISSDRVLLKESILADRSIMIIPGSSIRNFLSEGMVTRPVTEFPVTNGIYIIYRESDDTVRAFIDGMKERLPHWT